MASKHTKYVSSMKAFGKAVRFYRNKQGYSQEALADRAQLDRSYMSQIERGIKNATLNSIWRISQALGVSPSALLQLTEEVEQAGDAAAQLLERRLAEAGSTATAPRVASPLILVVDDDQDICSAVGSILKDSGFGIVEATSGLEAMRVLAREHVDCVVSDIRMANGNGLELLDSLRRHDRGLPFFFITGYDDVSAEDAIRRGATGLFNKPFDMRAFVASLKSSLPTAS